MATTSSKDLLNRIRHLALFRERPMTLKQLLDMGPSPSRLALMSAAQFLHQELPLRLAHRVMELENLPFGLAEMPSVRLVKDMYIDSTRELLELPRPAMSSDGMSFVHAIDSIKRRHGNVVPLMATGVLELKRFIGADALSPRIQEFLDRFFISRVGVRMLIGQLVSLHDAPRPHYVGLISAACSPAAVAREAVTDARYLCELRYGRSPEVGVFGKCDLTFPYVPSHLHRMLFELLKNSMRAVVEFHGADATTLPMIRIALAEGHEDVTIKISDEGGGIPRSGIPQIWTYLYTTAEPPKFDLDSPRSDFRAPLAGLGYGLPISRLYARYFGGDLQVISMEGYGTDAYLHLKRLGDAKEVLPRNPR